jgi:hypothetical protein
MSIVKVDSIPFQFDFTGGCNCCNCRGRQTVYVNSQGEVEKFDRNKSKDHESDYSKSLYRIKNAVQQFLELNEAQNKKEVEQEILETIQHEKTLRLRHIQTINRKLYELWGTFSRSSSENSPKS